MIRTKRWLLDGEGRFWDCGNNRSGEGYTDVTDSTDAEPVAARKQLERYLEDLPGPAADDPLLERYRQTEPKKAGARRQRRSTGGATEPRPGATEPRP